MPSTRAAYDPDVEGEADYRRVRAATEALCRDLAVEDYVAQSMPDASPIKWHLAHTTWFFEQFVLAARPGHRDFHPAYRTLFNSYYEALGDKWSRACRGLLSRPTVHEVFAYRRHVDEQMLQLRDTAALRSRVELGLHHEEQHQELMLTDVKHLFSLSPLKPVYRAAPADDEGATQPQRWLRIAGGLRHIGAGADGFAFDNERPRHRRWLEPFALATRLTTAGEYRAFVEEGGYRRAELWLADGWALVQREQWSAPLYWQRQNGDWMLFTLRGLEPLRAAAPVCHVSYYEADAYARWAGARLPSEAEWEIAAAEARASDGSFVEGGRLHPAPARGEGLQQLLGECWQWTASPYVAYPGFVPLSGALGEYNGKFMCNQMALRGASCATPRRHVRLSYRNFFPPWARWQFSGIRLARDAAD